MDHLLEVRNLSIELPRGKRKPPVKLVEGVDLSIGKRQNFGVVGESGCGKSITCSSIMGLLSFPLTVGRESSIRFQQSDGREVDIASLPPSALRKLRGKDISMIFQEPMTALDPMYTIEEQICESLRFHTDLSRSDMHKVALAMLKKVKIPRAEQILQDYPHHLSGGMLQRVMIAIALINNPRLLIADEPTTALDVTIQAQILDLLRNLKDRINSSIMLITHDLGVIAEMADYVVVMYAGRVVEKGTAQEIFANPAHPYTIGLMASKPIVGKKVDRLYSIPGKVPNPVNMPNYCYFKDRCEMALPCCDGEYPCEISLSPTHKVSCYRYYENNRKAGE